MEKTKKKKPIFKKWWFWVAVVIIIGAIGANMGDDEKKAKEPDSVPAQSEADKAPKKPDSKSDPEPKQQPTKEPEPEPDPVIVISASELYDAYDKNEVAADKKYKGQQLEITGTVNDIGKDILSKMYVTLKTDHLIGQVQVYFKKEHEDKLAELEKGQQITIVGKGDGLMMNVLIKNGEFK